MQLCLQERHFGVMIMIWFFFTYYDIYVTSGVKTFLTNSEPRDLHVCVHICVRCVCGVYICMFVFMYLSVVCVVFMCTCVSLWCAGCVSISVNVYVECVYGDIFIPISESVFYIFVFEIDRWLWVNHIPFIIAIDIKWLHSYNKC